MTPPLDLRPLLDALRKAGAIAGLEGALSALTAAASKGTYAILDSVDEQIGRAEAPALRKLLIDLRPKLNDLLVDAERVRVTAAFRGSAERGWEAWRAALADAVARFRFRFGKRLAEIAPLVLEGRAEDIRSYRRMLDLLSQARWAEALEPMMTLLEVPSLTAETRAGLTVTRAEIEYYHRKNRTLAVEILELAGRSTPLEGRVLSAQGTLWLRERETEKARSCFDRCLQEFPSHPDAYLGRAELAEGEKDLQAAELWFRKAIGAAPGKSSGYSRLARFYGRPDQLAVHEKDLLTLVERGLEVEPDDEFSISQDVGYCYEQSQRYAEAESWYQRAIGLDPSCPQGYILLAQGFDRQGLGDRAAKAYRKSIDVAPECPDGYWGLGYVHEKARRWKDALELYRRAPQGLEPAGSEFRAKIGEMLWKLGQSAEAESLLLEEARRRPDRREALDTVERIARELYTERGQPSDAVRLFNALLEARGDSYKGSYHNQLGNLHYYEGNHSKAMVEYLQAIAVEPAKAVYHRNLAGVFQATADYSRARQLYEKAFQLDRNDEEYKRSRAQLENAQGNDHYGRSEYAESIGCYERAIELNPNTAIYHANLAGAWQELRQPGKRLEAQRKAIDAYQQAFRLGGNPAHERSAQRAARRRDFAARYGEKVLEMNPAVLPIALDVGEVLSKLIDGGSTDGLSPAVREKLAGLREAIQNEYGIKVPGVKIRGGQADFPGGTFVVSINEVPMVSGSVPPDCRFCPGPEEALHKLGVKGDEEADPLTNQTGLWIRKDDWAKVEAQKLELWEETRFPFRRLEATLRANLAAFLTHDEIDEAVKALPGREPTERPATLTELAAVCRSLLEEGVPIKPFAAIVSMADRLLSQGQGLADVVREVRASEPFVKRLPGKDGRHEIHPVGPAFEKLIQESLHRSGSAVLLALIPERTQDALTAVRNSVSFFEPTALLVENEDLRAHVRRLVEAEFPAVPVLSRRELGDNPGMRLADALEYEPGPAEQAKENEPVAPRPSASASNRRSGTSNRRPSPVPEAAEPGITVAVSAQGVGHLAAVDDTSLQAKIALMQEGLFYELGILFPEPKVETDSRLKPNEFRFTLNGRKLLPVPGLDKDEFLVNDTVDRLTLLSITGREAVNPANKSEAAVIREEGGAAKSCRDAGLTLWDAEGYMILALSAEIRKLAHTFQSVDVTQYGLDTLQGFFPTLVDSARKRFSPEQLTLILQSLLEEQISIRNLATILEGLLSVNGTTDVDMTHLIVMPGAPNYLCPAPAGSALGDLSPVEYGDFVRCWLKRYISHKYTRGGSSIQVFLVGTEVEKRLGEAGVQPLTSAEKGRLIDAVREELANLPDYAPVPVILTSPLVRKPIRSVVGAEFPDLAVISYQELTPDVSLQPIARISWN